MKLFVGLTFQESHLHYKKIDSFRCRFDKKYSCSSFSQMTLLPPFWVSGKLKGGVAKLVEHLEEELETHLHGFDHQFVIPFNGFDFKTGRGGVLYLRPELPDDLFHCQEVMREIIESHGGMFKKRKLSVSGLYADTETFLPIGRLTDLEGLELAIKTAQLEFNNPFNLALKAIALFEKAPNQWVLRKNLFLFDKLEADCEEDISKGANFPRLGVR